VWTERQAIEPGSTIPPDQLMTNSVTEIVARWAVDRDLSVESVAVRDSGVEIVVAGVAEPRVETLLSDLASVIGATRPVQVYFVERRPVTTTVLLEVIGGLGPVITAAGPVESTTSTATTTPTPTPTAATTTTGTGG
jgi:hypothetical protein